MNTQIASSLEVFNGKFFPKHKEKAAMIVCTSIDVRRESPMTFKTVTKLSS